MKHKWYYYHISIFKLVTIGFVLFVFLLCGNTFAFAQSYGTGSYGGGNYIGNTSSSQNTSTHSCAASAPPAIPDLYEIDVMSTNATLFIAPPPQPFTDYQISFGDTPKDEGYNVTFAMWNATGALAYTVHDLQPNSLYSFKVRALNNCMPGNWSSDIDIFSGSEKGSIVKKYYPATTATLSYKPNTVVTQKLDQSSAVISGKPQDFVPTPYPSVKHTTHPLSLWDRIINFFVHLF